MELNDLKEYLRVVVDSERNYYLIDDTIRKIKNDIAKLAIRKSIPIPEKPKEIEPDINTFKTATSTVIGIVGLPVLIFGILMFAAGVDACKTGLGFIGFLMIVIALVVIYAGLMLALNLGARSEDSSKRKKCNSENQKNLLEYEERMEEYHTLSILDSNRVENEEIVKKNLTSKIEFLEEQLFSYGRLLRDLYSMDIVYEKYRNFTMMCSIYEYINSGRCYTLEGPDGAYNILENEIRMDRIIVQFDLVLSNLEQIKANQYTIYKAIQENNRQQRLILESTDQILSCMRNMNNSIQNSTEELKASLESIDKNSALTAYAAERSQKELEYMNTMNYLQSKYSGTGFNQPPSWRS